MSAAEISVNVAGLAIIAWIVWYFWLWKPETVRAQATAGDLQVVDITVKGGYQPAAVVVSMGKPVRLNVTRREATTCGEELLFPAFGKRVYLPENQTIPVELVPQEPGEYEFTCGMNMYRGKLIVR